MGISLWYYWWSPFLFLYFVLPFWSLNIAGFAKEMLTSDTMNISMSEIICPSSEKLETPINLQEPKEPSFFSPRANSNSTIEIEHVHFPPQIVPVLLIILLPLICLKSPTFFTKFNSLGTANIFFLIGVVFYFATKWGINANFGDIDANDYIPMFKAQYIH